MIKYVKFIGVIDNEGIHHFVELTRGLNIITGRSSTGKSALIEVFDYCLGSSEDTIPYGEITKYAKVFFVVFSDGESDVVAARTAVAGLNKKASKGLLQGAEKIVKESDGKLSALDEVVIDINLVPMNVYKKKLNIYFDVDYDNIEEDHFSRQENGRKSSTPSVRSFPSYMLQHQNLVANKHALFYRFDEREKREQAIEHFLIFLGFLDQDYFLLSQQLSEKNTELKKLERLVPKTIARMQKLSKILDGLMNDYIAVTSRSLVEVSANLIVQEPKQWLEFIRDIKPSFDSKADVREERRIELSKDHKEVLANLMDAQREAARLGKALEQAVRFSTASEQLNDLEEVALSGSVCPMCDQDTDFSIEEAGRMGDAIQWLNNELGNVFLHTSRLQVQKAGALNNVESLKSSLDVINEELKKLDALGADLRRRETAYELALLKKVKIESYLEELIDQDSFKMDTDLEALRKEVERLSGKIRAYNVYGAKRKIEKDLTESMNTFGRKLDFEKNYNPINFGFSIDDFELWLNVDDEKVFLRSMGSGANWLYSHLCLFLSLNKLFLNHSDSSKVPPILFLDQPSQVYFPNIKSDVNEQFDPTISSRHVLKEDKGGGINVDMEAVDNFFTVIADYCNGDSKSNDKIPQVIITDHADELPLGDKYDFEKFVRARWRSENSGFITLPRD